MPIERFACLAAGVVLAAAVLLAEHFVRSVEAIARFLTGGN
jgi:hypothetical protein